MPIEKQKQTFLGQAFEDEPFGFAYDKYGNLIPGTKARPLKVRMNDGRVVLTAAEADANCFRRNRPWNRFVMTFRASTILWP